MSKKIRVTKKYLEEIWTVEQIALAYRVKKSDVLSLISRRQIPASTNSMGEKAVRYGDLVNALDAELREAKGGKPFLKHPFKQF